MEKDDKVETPTKEEYDALQAKLEDLDSKHKASTTEGQRLHHENEFLKDPSTFEKLYQTNRNFATDIAKKYGFDDVEKFREAVKGMKPSVPGKQDDPKDDEDALTEKLLAKLEEKDAVKTANATVQKFCEERGIDLESDFGKEVMAEYKELVGTRKLDTEKANKYIRIAYKEVKQVSKHAEEHEKKLDQLKSVGMGGKNTKTFIDEKKIGPTFNKPFKFRDEYAKK